MSSLAELRAHPRDRARLHVHADWLQARGEPHGELIAVQDAAACATSVAAFGEAHARARALLEAHPQLCPPAPGDRDQAPRKQWLCWDRGFVRRLELLVDEASPGRDRDEFTDGPSGWSELLAALLDHPALALVESILIRVELVEASFTPAFEQRLAVDIATRGLERWHAEAGPRPDLQLALWTSQAPSYETHAHLSAALPKLRPMWYAPSLTIVPPPANSPASELDIALAPSMVAPAGWRHIDLVWFDVRGQFVARVESDRDVWRTHVRGLAERRSPPDLASGDPLALRRIGGVLAELAARYRPSANGLVSAPLASVEPVSLSEGLVPLASVLSEQDLFRAEPALYAFEAQGTAWYRVEWTPDESSWTALVGLGPEMFLMLAKPG